MCSRTPREYTGDERVRGTNVPKERCCRCGSRFGVTMSGDARVWMDQDGVEVHDTRSPQGIYVNDDPVSGKCALRAGEG